MGRVKTDYLAFLPMLVLVGLCGFAYAKSVSAPTPELYDSSKPVAVAELHESVISIPTWHIFSTGQLWSLVNSNRTLPLDFKPELTTTTVAHAPAAGTIGAVSKKPLESMILAAEADGVRLMLSSAYRSADDQQATYDSFLTQQGKEYVHEYVALPGASEHQTGLAFDIATLTQECKIDPSECSLDAESIAWLRQHAADYGFIERYPSGKQSITGVAAEHWHYRYVGVPLASALTAANMTLDEFIAQVAPGYTMSTK